MIVIAHAEATPEVTEILGDFECRGLLGPPGLDHGFLGGAMGWGRERAAKQNRPQGTSVRKRRQKRPKGTSLRKRRHNRPRGASLRKRRQHRPKGTSLRKRRQNRPKGTSLRKRRPVPSLTSKGYIDKAAKLSCARNRPKRTFLKRNFKGKLKEKTRHRFPGGGGPGAQKNDQKVHR